MSDAEQPEPTGSPPKGTASRRTKYAIAIGLIVAVGMAIGTRFPDYVPWPVGEDDSPGARAV